MSKPMFSIIIPVYNAEHTITRTITELKDLGTPTYEVILVNDGSTDQTKAIIEQQIASDNRFSLISKENQGPGMARNTGIEHATGEYVLFFDADDYPKQSILEDYAKIVSRNPDLDLVVGSFNFQTVDQGKVVSEKEYIAQEHLYSTHEEFIEDMYTLMNQQLMYVVWNKCYRRDHLMNYGIRFKNYSSCEDRIFNLEYYAHCKQVQMSEKLVYIYEFVGGEGITNKYKSGKYETFKEFYEEANRLTKNQSEAGMAALHLKGTTSVIFSILETEKLSRKEKNLEINKILADAALLNAKSVAITDTTTKKITKILYNTPKWIFRSVVKSGSFVEVKLPGVMALLKRVY
ncbi:MAG: glycosyltransferase family 2 protein [Enterococcus sp.]